MTTVRKPDKPGSGLPFSLWLLPRANEMADWQALIGRLAERFATPVFPPHVTLATGTRPPGGPMNSAALQNLRDAMTEVAGASPPLTLSAQAVSTGTCRFQCVMIDLPDGPVQQLAGAIADRLGNRSDHPVTVSLQPAIHTHLSLIYATLAASERRALAAGLQPVHAQVCFDRIAMVLPGPGRTNFDYPSEWEMLDPIALTGPV